MRVIRLPALPFAAAVSMALSACVGNIDAMSGGESTPGTPGAPGTPSRPGQPGVPDDGTPPTSPGTVATPGTTVKPADFTTPPPPSSDPVAFACKAGAAPAPTPPMRRMTATQYRNTVRDLVTLALKKSAAETLPALADIKLALDSVPNDERERVPQDPHGSYRRLDQTVDQAHADAYYNAARAVGAALTKPARLAGLAGTCATDADTANDGACVDAFLKSFGERVLRAPLAAEDVTFYRRFFDRNASMGTAQGFADLLAGLLSSPAFLYVVENGDGTALKPNVYALGTFELATRLSMHFWQSMPDDDLWQAAKSGALKTKEGYERQVMRLWADPRARESMDEFYRDWLKLEDLPQLTDNNGDAAFKKFAGTDLPTKALRTNMIDDALALVRHVAFDTAGTVDDLFTTDLSFARTDDLATIYGGVAKWTPGQTPPRFAAGTRPGLLTRAAFLATGLATTRPVLKGVFIRRSILCDDIPPPPDNANAEPPMLDPKLTQRQVLEKLTEQTGSACAACHIPLINHLGYPTERFDALGRKREMERLITLDGKEMGTAPLVTRSVPQVLPGDTTSVETPSELMSVLVKSGKPHACFARSYFRFTFGRWENADADGCLLERMRQTLAKGGALTNVLRDTALAPEFQQKVFQ